MVFQKLRILAFPVLSLAALCGCANVIERVHYNPNLATPISIYLCNYFANGFDDLNTCQSTTDARCTSTFEVFPSGATANCYFPSAGFEACTGTPSWDWIYTTYSDWCATPTAGTYLQTRSVITCSSSICTCNNPQLTSRTCTGAGDCGTYTPNPLTVVPTPAPCP